eukprot:15809150-Heterocapsa_arctica.AAC.1
MGPLRRDATDADRALVAEVVRISQMQDRSLRAEGLLAGVRNDPDAVEHTVRQGRRRGAQHLSKGRRLHPQRSQLGLRDRVEEVTLASDSRRNRRISRHRDDAMRCQVEGLHIVIRSCHDP